jgi:hypothetical protein
MCEQSGHFKLAYLLAIPDIFDKFAEQEKFVFQDAINDFQVNLFITAQDEIPEFRFNITWPE